MRKVLGLSMMAIFAVACATQPSLRDYQATSLDEQKIVNLVLEFQEAYSSQNAERILATYAPNAMIKTSMTKETKKRDWSGVMLPKEEHAAILLSKQIDFYKRVKIKLEIYPPKEIFIKRNEASMTASYELYSTNPYKAYVETGILYFKFRKSDSGWLISKRTWEILDCNHPDFNEWKKKQQ